MQLNALRTLFLEYFKKHQHEIVASSPLIPFNDETLLFTNAGMVQFKETFLGQEKREYTRAVSSQKCVRAGGKHNDLENVGYTARHHTFFEMLGNFSFGDYFKREAIELAWNFLTQELKLPPEKLWVTVFHEDQEAEDIWLKEMKVSPQRFSRCGEKDNFWSMGETGPCGPCSEIFYDHGPDVAGGPPGSEDEDGDRYVEIWNIVFMQYNRSKDGVLSDLPKPSVDTGMGLERMAAVMQGVHSNYDIDLFKALINEANKLIPQADPNSKSFSVIADHIRASCFLIVDGIIPSNEGRGYVLRRIMRRALRHGHQLGAQQPFFYKLVGSLAMLMGEAYPDLKNNQKQIEKMILKEEEQFARTLDQGMKILESEMANSQGHISGALAFKLYDTYGFPIDLTADIAREKGTSIDLDEFEQHMLAQRQRARSQSQFNVDYNAQIVVDEMTPFLGYEQLESQAIVKTLLRDGQETDSVQQGDQAIVVLDQTPFYAESGGQVGDQGVLQFKNARMDVQDTKKAQKAILHIGIVEEGEIKVGDSLKAKVNQELRQSTVLNHSATHLLHAALREILGEHVVQKGSLVAPDRLRFDFSHFEALTSDQIQEIEKRVNQKILENSEAVIKEMPFDDAIAEGVMALFGEKYDKNVRVLNLGDGYSKELCGGTHVNRTGDIGLFVITQEMGIASGIRRIEAFTGFNAFTWLKNKTKVLQDLQTQLKADDVNVADKMSLQLKSLKRLEKENQQLKQKLASSHGGDLAEGAKDIKGVKLLVKKLDQADPKMMRQLVDDLKNKLGQGVVILAAVDKGKVQLIVGVTKNCTGKVSANELIKFLAGQLGGTGGGRPDMAQAGGNHPEKLDAALNSVEEWVNQRVI